MKKPTARNNQPPRTKNNMPKTRTHPTLDSLMAKFPFLVKHPELIGLRFKLPTEVSIAVKKGGDEKLLTGVRLKRGDNVHTVYADEEIDQSWLAALSAPDCAVTLEIEDSGTADDVRMHISARRLAIETSCPAAMLGFFLESDEDADPEAVPGSEEQ